MKLDVPISREAQIACLACTGYCLQCVLKA